MRKGVAYLFRYRDVSMSANSRYVDGLAVVSDPTAKVSELARVTRRKQAANGRTARAFNPLARDEVQLFQAVLDGADTLHGFTNKDVEHACYQHLTSQHSNRTESARARRSVAFCTASMPTV